MWMIENETAYAADRTWVRDKDGHHHWIVVAKATFDFGANGVMRLADQQHPALHDPEYFGEPGASSIRFEADLIARKPTTDVIVNAHAHAPHGRPTNEVVVTLRIADVDKTLVVRGESRYGFGITGPSISTPEPFVTRAITYEHAYGGTDTLDEDPAKHRIDPRNPIGTGLAYRNEHLYGRPAPSVYYPRGNPAKVGPAGFGAIASYWSPRLELGGTYDAVWAETKKPLLPDDFHEIQLLCGPADQRPRTRLRGGERIELHNMTYEGALGLELPRIALTATTRASKRTVEQHFELATVVIEAEARQLIMVWQCALMIAGADVDYVDGSLVREVSFG